MHRYIFALLGALALTGCPENAAPEAGSSASADGAAPVAPGTPVTEDDKTLYALGLSIGQSVEVFSLTPAELELVQSGLKDQVTGQTAKVDLETYGPKLTQLAMARGNAKAAEEKKKGAEFAAKAAAEAGAQTTPSGLVYLETTPGTGATPTAENVVKVHYRGTLIDGTEFDSSFKRNEPAVFPLKRVVPCWTEGLQKMKVGGKATLVCPSEIGYGDRGSPPKIPGGATLKFEVELLEIVGGG